VCCVLDTESDTLQVCWLNGQSIHETVPGPRFASHRDLVATWPGQNRDATQKQAPERPEGPAA
jgi:hypothetical protein